MLASGKSTAEAGAACAEALCSHWPGPCAEQRGVETTDQGARDFCSQDSFSDIQGSLVFVTILPASLALRRQPPAGKGTGRFGPRRLASRCPCTGSHVSPAHLSWWLPNRIPCALKELQGPSSEPGQSPREITAVRHGEGERASHPACNYDPPSADCRSPIN